MLDPGLETGDVVLDLLDERQVIAQFVEARIGRHGVAGIQCDRAGSDEDGIQPVILGAAEVQLGERLDLERLQHDDDEAVGLQMPGDGTFVATGRLDADALDTGLGELGGETVPSIRGVGERGRARLTVDGHVELVFGGIDSCRNHGSLCHLR